MANLILPKVTLKLQTRMQHDIDNCLDRTSPIPGMQQQIDDYRRQYNAARHRPGGPCPSYNCHGLTFGTRRTAITNSAEVVQTLKDDDYAQIQRPDVVPGDIAVYFKDGDVEHSGIVVETRKLGPLIVSKWGGLHEGIHNLGECPYDASDVRFYRVIR